MKEYTFVACVSVLAAVYLDIRLKTRLLRQKHFWFFLALLAVCKAAVNGYLTGSYIVVYNPAYFLGFRIGTIPCEDFLFGFSMATSTIVLWHMFKKKCRHTNVMPVVFCMCVLSGAGYGRAFAHTNSVTDISVNLLDDWKALHDEAEHTSLVHAKRSMARGTSALRVSDPARFCKETYVRALVFLSAYRDEDARTCFMSILSVLPESVPAQWGLAEILRREYRFDQSREMLAECIRKNPSFAPAYISMAYLAYVEQKFSEAARLANHVVEMGRERVDAENLTRAYLLLAGAKGMIAHYGGPILKMVHGMGIMPNLRRAQNVLPHNAAVYFGLGAYYLLAPAILGGNIADAKLYLAKAVELDPLLADAWVRLAQVYRAQGDEKNYQACLAKALSIDPRNILAGDIINNTCKFICVPPTKE